MKCKCGKDAKIYSKGENRCWDCYTRTIDKPTPVCVVHIDTPATLTTPRAPLCGQGFGDPIYHMTPTVAASYMAQHPDQQSEFCGACLTVMYRGYLSAIAEARLYAATLKK